MKKMVRRIKKLVVKVLLQPMSEAVGFPRWCRKPALNSLDQKLSKYLNFRNGIFVEAGANDGFTQSNTFFLEKGLNWSGVLVEAIPDLYDACKKIRTRSHVFHAGLVSDSYVGETLKLHYANLMSIAEGAMDADMLQSHVSLGLQCQNIRCTYSVEVPAVTFCHILNEVECSKIDFLSIDLEGYEIEALKGWDFKKHRPRYILIEVRDLGAVDKFFNSCSYQRIEKLTDGDYLYEDVKSPSISSRTKPRV